MGGGGQEFFLDMRGGGGASQNWTIYGGHFYAF